MLDDADKAKTNPHFRSRYADLAAVREALRKPLSDNGISYTQIAGGGEGFVEVETILMHASGQHIGGVLRMPVAQNTPQGFGSALTYARRYSLMAAVGIAASEDDDDGNAGSERASARGGGSAMIGEDEIARLQDLIIEAGADPLRFYPTSGLSI
jgi:hypothetical protein